MEVLLIESLTGSCHTPLCGTLDSRSLLSDARSACASSEDVNDWAVASEVLVDAAADAASFNETLISVRSARSYHCQARCKAWTGFQGSPAADVASEA